MLVTTYVRLEEKSFQFFLNNKSDLSNMDHEDAKRYYIDKKIKSIINELTSIMLRLTEGQL